MRWIGVLASLVVLQTAMPACAQPASAPMASAAASAGEADPALQGQLVVNHRLIFTFRAALLGRKPRERALAAGNAVAVVLERGGPGHVTPSRADDGSYIAQQIDGLIVFHVTTDDLDPGM